jgi:hypothetical protein
MAGRNVTAVVLYVVAFLISLRFFVKGQHELAWMMMFGAFLLALVCVLCARRQ